VCRAPRDRVIVDGPQMSIRDRVIGYLFRFIDEDTSVLDVNDLHMSNEDNTVVKITFSRKK